MIWRRSTKKLVLVSAVIGASCPPGWGSGGEDCCWLRTLSDLA